MPAVPAALRDVALREVLPFAPGQADPREVPGLVGWWDARFLDLNDGDPVGTWPDLSGNGHDLTQATTSRKPTFRKAYNGQPSVEFDGVDDLMNGPDVVRGAPFTCISKCGFLSSGTPQVIFQHLSNASPFLNWRHRRTSADTYILTLVDSTGTKVDSGFSALSASEHILCYRLSSALSATGSIDGQNVISKAYASEQAAAGKLRISDSPTPFHGWFRYQLLYNRDLTDAELEYLANV